jgi:DNA-binding response OmpR family regulator
VNWNCPDLEGCSDSIRLPPVLAGIFDLLWKEKRVHRDRIKDRIWGHAVEFYDQEKLLAIHIHRLRKKLARMDCSIETIHGYGYRLNYSPRVMVWDDLWSRGEAGRLLI